MKYYVYVLMDTRRPGEYQYGSYRFAHEPFYVGKGKGKRWQEHISDAFRAKVDSHKQNKIRRIIAETGELPAVVILAEELEDADAFALEIEVIALIGRDDQGKGPLTNKTDGGKGQTGLVHTEETKELIRQKLIAYVEKHGNGFAGKHHTEEAKAKKREASKRAWSDPKRREEQSRRNSGDGNPNYGRKHTEEERRKISEAKKRMYAENPDKLAESRRRLKELNARLGPLTLRVSEQGRKNQGEAAKERWADPEMRQRMIANTIKTWEVTSPDGEVVIVKNLRGYMIGLGYPKTAPGNLASYGKWRGWKARKVE